MEIKYHRHSRRQKKAFETWTQVLNMYNAGQSAVEIAKTLNKTRAWVYFVLRKFKNNEAIKL